MLMIASLVGERWVKDISVCNYVCLPRRLAIFFPSGFEFQHL